jgi:peptidoglycan/LPS O-acetylase OafA/YrhL
LPIVSIGISVIVSEIYKGSLHLGERTFFSAIPMYFFGMALAKYHQHNKDWPKFFHSKMLWVLSGMLFIGILISRNSEAGIWDHLFAEGRFIAFLLTAGMLAAPAFLTFFSAQGIGVKLGQLTYEIYLFHGLMAYVMSVYIPQASAVTIILFFWVLPVLMSFGWDIFSKKIFLFSQGKKA